MCVGMDIRGVWCVSCIVLFFFKQKTAYEMRISDWSSDVCSSDLISWRDRAGLFQGLVGDHREQRFLGQGLSRAGRESHLIAGVVKAQRIVRKMTMGIVLVHNCLDETPKLKVGRFGPAFALQRIQTEFRSEEHTSELQSLMRISYVVFSLKKTNI